MLANVLRRKNVAHASLWCMGQHLSAATRTFTTSVFLLARPRHIIHEGRNTDSTDKETLNPPQKTYDSRSPFYLETGYSIFAKRPSRPFPPPFVSYPSGSFSDPLTTYDRVKHGKPSVDGEYLKGITNGDDAILISNENFLCVNDGVGAWAQKDRGHAALWSRLIAHYWAIEVEHAFQQSEVALKPPDLQPIKYLQSAYEATIRATTQNADPKDIQTPKTPAERGNEILGTTTATSGLLHFDPATNSPILFATQVGDCALLVLRPDPSAYPPPSASDTGSTRTTDPSDDPPEGKCIYKTKEQWHWFDCPRQLGTNSPDTPLTPSAIAVCDTIPLEPSDIVVVCSDGVTDNLWEHEIVSKVCEAYLKWQSNEPGTADGAMYIARELMNAARVIAQDPYAESPYMERALDEGIAAEGGKLDDISVLIGICRQKAHKDE